MYGIPMHVLHVDWPQDTLLMVQCFAVQMVSLLSFMALRLFYLAYTIMLLSILDAVFTHWDILYLIFGYVNGPAAIVQLRDYLIDMVVEVVKTTDINSCRNLLLTGLIRYHGSR